MQATPPRWSAATWRDDILLAARFLTRLPLPAPAEGPPGGLAQASWTFPLVGAVVGLLGGLANVIAIWLGLPALAAALIAVGVTVFVTGALHEDGLADTADGFGGGATKDEKLAIMRDSRIGAYGVLALILSISIRAAAIAAFGDDGHVVLAMIAAHAVARGGLPLVQRALEPARADGLGATAGRPDATVAWTAAVIGALVALFALGAWWGIVALLATAVVMTLTVGAARRQIGGYTGDVLGAIEQKGEIVMLLVAASWAT